MKNVYSALIATTALGLSMSMAQAGDNNAAYLNQDGADNSASIDQSGYSNDAGDSSRIMLQDGDDNSISILQNNPYSTNGGAYIGTGGNYGQHNDGVDQLGNRNVISVNQKYGSGIYEVQQDSTGAASTPTLTANTVDATQQGNMRVNQIHQTYTGDGTTDAGNSIAISQIGGRFQLSYVGDSNGFQFLDRGLFQTGSGNSMDITQTGPGHALIRGIQTGKGNTATTTQTGAGNRINTIDQNSLSGATGNTAKIVQSGANNGVGGLSSGSFAEMSGADSSVVRQVGGGNDVDYAAFGNGNQFGFDQNGTDNTVGLITVTGDDNELGVKQDGTANVLDLGVITGDRNNVGVRQDGTNHAQITLTNFSDDNQVWVDQIGANTAAKITIDGDSNLARLEQNGTNSADINITGDFNNNSGTTNWDGVAANVLGLASVGLMSQTGMGNSLTVTVTSSHNLWATEQTGPDNTILASVGGGDGNRFAVKQVSTTLGNHATVTQNGNGNNAGVSQ